MYEFDEKAYQELRVLNFDSYSEEWLDFILNCRSGKDTSDYDIVVGGVANDKVFRVVDMYQSGIWDKERALEEIKVYPDYDQIAFISQKAINHLLCYESFYEVTMK